MQWLHVAWHVLLLSCIRKSLRLRGSVQEAVSRLPKSTMEQLEAWQEYDFSEFKVDGGLSLGGGLRGKLG